MTGLGAFLGAGADPVYDPILVQALQITEQSITHVATPNGQPAQASALGFSKPDNMALWADWVRSSVYITDFLKDLDWEVSRRPEQVTLKYGAGRGREFLILHRPTMKTFTEQLRFMRAYLDQRTDRAPEIMTQLGFPTSYFAMVLGLQTINRYTFELIGITQVLASHVAMVAKHHLACRRPGRIGAQVMPMIPTPAHGSFPSAHATEAYAVAQVLCALVDKQRRHYADGEQRKALLGKLAERIAVNRTVAGMHYPIDTWAGALLGRAVGQIILAKCGVAEQVDKYEYSAHGDRDFSHREFVKQGNPDFGVTKSSHFAPDKSDIFAWLWTKACDEFDLHNG